MKQNNNRYAEKYCELIDGVCPKCCHNNRKKSEVNCNNCQYYREYQDMLKDMEFYEGLKNG